MARHFAVPQFFRQVPNGLLKRFFADCEPFGTLDFEALPETGTEEMLKVWEGLSGTARRQLEPKMREIFDMSCQKGAVAFGDEAKWRIGDPAERDALIERLAGMRSHYERAMTIWLEHPEFWKAATRFYWADSMSHWKVRRGLPRKAASQDHDDRRAFATAIGGWFRENQARGRNCVVEVYRRDARDYFFAYPEDFADEAAEYVDNRLDRRAHNPAFEVVFVWKEADGTLEMNCQGGPNVLEAMQGLFARHILKLAKMPPAPRKPAYELDGLKDRHFPFVYRPGQGIQAVWVRRLRLASIARPGDRIVFEADTKTNKGAVYDLIGHANMAVPLARWHVSQAQIAAQLVATEDRPERTETFTVTYPNSTSLKHDEIEVTLRSMLAASGIEVK